MRQTATKLQPTPDSRTATSWPKATVADKAVVVPKHFPDWWYARQVRRVTPAGGRVLDMSCGEGQLLRRLAGEFETLGYDPSPAVRAACRAQATAAVILEDSSALADGSLDTIVAVHGVEDWPRPLHMVRALAAKLNNNGHLVLALPNPSGLGHRLKGRHWFANKTVEQSGRHTASQWAATLTRAGLEVIATQGDGLWDAPYVAWLPEAVQHALFGIPTTLQSFWPLRWSILPSTFGECLTFIARKRDGLSSPKRPFDGLRASGNTQ